jgi:hypothetical protein
LCFGPVLFQCWCVRAMLWFGGHFMLVFLQEFFMYPGIEMSTVRAL